MALGAARQILASVRVCVGGGLYCMVMREEGFQYFCVRSLWTALYEHFLGSDCSINLFCPKFSFITNLDVYLFATVLQIFKRVSFSSYIQLFFKHRWGREAAHKCFDKGILWKPCFTKCTVYGQFLYNLFKKWKSKMSNKSWSYEPYCCENQ